MRKPALIVAALAALFGAGPAAAQVTCRPSALGGETCIGLPVPGPRLPTGYRLGTRGLAGVQDQPGAPVGPVLVPAGRTDRLGNTRLEREDLPPPRGVPGVADPRNCGRDALGNLICR